MRGFDAVAFFWLEDYNFFFSAVILGLRNKFIIQHFLQDQIFSGVQLVFIVSIRRIISGGVGDGREISGLSQGDGRSFLAKEGLGGLLHAVNAPAIGVLIKVDGQDFIFTHCFFELYGQEPFFYLSGDCDFGSEQGVFYHLLGDG